MCFSHSFCLLQRKSFSYIVLANIRWWFRRQGQRPNEGVLYHSNYLIVTAALAATTTVVFHRDVAIFRRYTFFISNPLFRTPPRRAQLAHDFQLRACLACCFRKFIVLHTYIVLHILYYIIYTYYCTICIVLYIVILYSIYIYGTMITMRGSQLTASHFSKQWNEN